MVVMTPQPAAAPGQAQVISPGRFCSLSAHPLRLALVRILTTALSLALVLVLFLSTVPAHGAVDRPTPLAWDPWQHKIDHADSRLDSVVTVSESQITVADLTAHLSTASSVSLSVPDDLAAVRVTLFARDWPLAGVMLALSHLFEGHWWFTRGQLPSNREYRLGSYEAPLESIEEWLAHNRLESWKALTGPYRDANSARLLTYRAALALPPSEVLARYEQTDPWLCATILDPKLRPMIQQSCALAEDDQEHLFTYGFLDLPLRRFDFPFRQHLAHWAKSQWGPPSARSYIQPDVDHLFTYHEPEQRWSNSILRFYWAEETLQLQVRVPDVGEYGEQVIFPAAPDEGPYRARLRLVQLGYREKTAEYQACAKREQRAWQEAHSPAERPHPTDRSPHPDEADPRLAAKIVFDLTRDRRMSLPALLERAADQCEIAVVAHYFDDQVSPLPETREHPAELTLAELLGRLQGQLGPRLSWRLYGANLVLRNPRYRVQEAYVLPELLLRDWQDALQPGETITLEDLSALLARTNRLQLATLRTHLGDRLAALSAPLSVLGIYGRLDDAQRPLLYDPAGLTLAGLGEDEIAAVWLIASRTRTWVRKSDLAHTVLKAAPRKLATGEQGISLIAEYHFPDAPDDRDVLFTSPLRFTVPPASSPDTPAAPTPSP